MSVPELGKAMKDLASPGVAAPHEKVAEFVRRRGTARIIRFRQRTRALLVFIGSIAIISSWLLPWYVSMGWLSTTPAIQAALSSGYQVTNLGSGDVYAKWGLNPLIREFSGANLAAGPAPLRSIAFSRDDFYLWVALAVFSLLALWTAERTGRLRSAARERLYKIFESGKVILLVITIARSVWKGVSLTSEATVSRLAEASLVDTFPAGTTASSVQHFVTNFSVGLITLFLGLVFAALGVFSGDKKPRGEVVVTEAAARVRVSAGLLAFLALAFIFFSWLIFGAHS